MSPLRRVSFRLNTFLWLSYADRIDLGISLLFIVATYLLSTWLVRRLLPRLVRRTKTAIDDQLLQVAGSNLRWLAVVLILTFATKRLNFYHSEVKSFLLDLCFFVAEFLVVVILWRLIDLCAQVASDRAKQLGYWEGSRFLITLSVWLLRMGLLIFVLSNTLGRFAINITWFAIFVLLVGVTLSLAGRDIFADIVSGVLILVDRPFRIGDRIGLTNIDSVGNVFEIGTRYTKILTVDNRMVIIPNAQIGKNQVINYSYPDSSVQDVCNFLVAYENDVDAIGS